MVIDDLHSKGYAKLVYNLFRYSEMSGLGIERLQQDYLPGSRSASRAVLTISSEAQIEDICKEYLELEQEIERRGLSTVCTQPADCHECVLTTCLTSGVGAEADGNGDQAMQYSLNPYDVYTTIILSEELNLEIWKSRSSYCHLEKLMKSWKSDITNLIILPEVLDTQYIHIARQETHNQRDCASAFDDIFESVVESIILFKPQNICLTLGQEASTCCQIGASIDLVKDCASIIAENIYVEDTTIVQHGRLGGKLYNDWSSEELSGQLTYQIHIDLLKEAFGIMDPATHVGVNRCWEHMVDIMHICSEDNLVVNVHGTSEEEFAHLHSVFYTHYTPSSDLPYEEISFLRSTGKPDICTACSKPWF